MKSIDSDKERSNLLESEAYYRDFAEASAEWFWETDEQLNVKLVDSQADGFDMLNLNDFPNVCHSHTSNELLKIIKARQKLVDIIVYSSGKDGVMQYMRVSAKPILDQDGEFVGYRGVGRDVTQSVSQNQRTEFLASHDELTGLPNRNLFRQRLEDSISKAERSSKQVLLLFFDLDYFKMVNDTLGHDAGDKLLIQAVERISACARSTDLLCRLGGDEFVMVMEGASPQDGNRIVRAIIAAFEPPFDIHDQRVFCTVSVGVSVYPEDTKDPETLLLYADLAMYRAKQNGRNNFEFYTSGLNFIAHQWLEMEQGIRQALKDNLLFLAYQPQYDYETNALVGVEALLRWRHPQHGLIPPLEFIQVAEQSALINQVGEFVFEESCSQLRKWLDAGYKVPRISINISPRQLRSSQLSQMLLSITTKYQIPPNVICLEITEHALLEGSDEMKGNMKKIKEAGFKVSLDEFGLGNLSLMYLMQWNVDEIKIDQSFVSELGQNKENDQLVNAIAALSGALKLGVVAEGVESQEQGDILADNGCHQMQGYFYSLPLTPKELEKTIKNK